MVIIFEDKEDSGISLLLKKAYESEDTGSEVLRFTGGNRAIKRSLKILLIIMVLYLYMSMLFQIKYRL